MKILKVMLFTILIAPLLSVPGAAHTAGGDHEQVDATRYYSGQKTELTADYANDVFYFGQELTTSGDIGDNLLGLAGKIVIAENVYNSVYIAAGQIQIDGNVSNDLNIVGGYVVVNGYVGGDLRVSGGTVIINSPFVGADLAVAGGQVYINEQITVTGKRTVSAGDELASTNIPTDLSQAPSLVNFTTITELVSSRGEKSRTIEIDEGIVDWITTLLGQIIAGYVMLRLFPVFATKTMKLMRTGHLRTISVGLATLFCALLLLPILMFSVIGTKLLFILIVLGVLALYLGQLYASYMLAQMLLLRIKRPQTGRLLVVVAVAVLLVNTVIPLLGLLPVIGGLLAGIASLTLYCWGLGAIILGKYQAFTKKKSS